jgi:hypothetical protein
MRKLALLLLWSMWLGCRAETPPEETLPDAGPGGGPRVEQECAQGAKPTCCWGCGDELVSPVCTAGSWSCPSGSTDERQCPSTPDQPACSLPRHPQETYTYPGCANEDQGCPRLKTVYCALNTLRAEHTACEQDSDCVAATVNGRCTGYGQCPPAMVNAAGRADFEAKAAAEVSRYCTESPICSSSGSCAFPSFVPRCRQGSCVAEPPDAGS